MSDKPKNAQRRAKASQTLSQQKAKDKLARRIAQKKAELADPSLKAERLAKNIPRTIENTREWLGDALEDARTRPVQIKNVEGMEQGEEMQLDLAGLEHLFSDTTSTKRRPILLTTSPRPHAATYNFLSELENLLGGKKFAQSIPRKNARFELSKVVKWAIKRDYKAVIVVGEDKEQPSSMTISLLPNGPTAHFKLTTVRLHRQISNSARPTAHLPELVLSNFSTPLGLSVGRILQNLFPPLPQLVGRQVVAVHCQRDFIFFRRFRYMFALRQSDVDKQRAKTQGMDPEIRTRMQEIGPRFTLKLRWIKKGTLAEGRKRGTDGTTQLAESVEKIADQAPEGAFKPSEDGVKQTEEEARLEMMASLGEEESVETSKSDKGKQRASDDEQEISGQDEEAAPVKPKEKITKRKRSSLSSIKPKEKRIKIPTIKMQPLDDPNRKKPRKNASILDSVSLQGGMRKEKMEWEWRPDMQVSRRRFFL